MVISPQRKESNLDGEGIRMVTLHWCDILRSAKGRHEIYEYIWYIAYGKKDRIFESNMEMYV
jgi:hypothetical protein